MHTYTYECHCTHGSTEETASGKGVPVLDASLKKVPVLPAPRSPNKTLQKTDAPSGTACMFACVCVYCCTRA